MKGRYHRLVPILLHYWFKKSNLSCMPVKLWIESTNHCNLRCVMCPSRSDRVTKRGFMELSLFKKIIDESAESVYSVNLHHRGEPLLHKDLPEMIQYCKKKGIYTQIHTNGTLLTRSLSRAILESGLDLISFSMDGYDKRSYESIRAGANFEKTLENIRGFVSQRNETGGKKPEVLLEFIDFFKGDPVKISKMKAYAKAVKVDRLIIKSPHNWAGSFFQDNKKKSRRTMSLWPACTFPWYALTILWDGTVVACPQDFYGKTAVGNVRDKTLKECWNHPLHIQLRNVLKKKEVSARPCSVCDRIGRSLLLGIPAASLEAFFKEIFN